MNNQKNKYGKFTLSTGKRVYYGLKAAMDFVISLVALVVLAVPMGILAVIIKLDDRGPVFFRQKRIGRDQKTFMMLKFRTMRTDTPKDTATHLLADPQRYITKVGKFLRKTSLDELPQLLNILAGHMSIVGPRPALWNQYDLMEEREKYGVHQVRPGLTGWAQVNGRDELEIPVKARLDGQYIEKFGFLMDVRCFFATFGILGGKGVVEGGTGELHRREEEQKEKDHEKSH
jgi:O-antigen biosynthesis protein WbqP